MFSACFSASHNPLQPASLVLLLCNCSSITGWRCRMFPTWNVIQYGQGYRKFFFNFILKPTITLFTLCVKVFFILFLKPTVTLFTPCVSNVFEQNWSRWRVYLACVESLCIIWTAWPALGSYFACWYIMFTIRCISCYPEITQWEMPSYRLSCVCSQENGKLGLWGGSKWVHKSYGYNLWWSRSFYFSQDFCSCD